MSSRAPKCAPTSTSLKQILHQTSRRARLSLAQPTSTNRDSKWSHSLHRMLGCARWAQGFQTAWGSSFQTKRCTRPSGSESARAGGSTPTPYRVHCTTSAAYSLTTSSTGGPLRASGSLRLWPVSHTSPTPRCSTSTRASAGGACPGYGRYTPPRSGMSCITCSSWRHSVATFSGPTASLAIMLPLPTTGSSSVYISSHRPSPINSWSCSRHTQWTRTEPL
mmetsp:Transcript_37991/g.80862  ORF Transcript_37991/g.80862 Transcript_37991/m.80862 type:complete len:221 (-) Transcript_37991:409-1071(-)